MDKKEDYNDALTIAKKKHDIIGLHVYDKREKELPNSGLAQFVDSETGESLWIDSSNKQVRENYTQYFIENLNETKKTFAGVYEVLY